jgi:sec-independent protein translocase protein TatC
VAARRFEGVLDLVRAARRRLRLAIAVVGISWVVAFLFAERLVALLARPLVHAWSRRAAEGGLGPARLHFGSLIEPFWTYLDVAFWTALIVSSPVLLHLVWRAIAPRLAVRHRRLGVPFAVATGACFAGGVAFGFLVVLPMAYEFLLSYAAQNLAAIHDGLGGAPVSLRPALMVDPYLSLTVRMLLAFGAIFELPVLLAILAWLGVVDHRGLLRFGRWAIVVAFVVAAILTPGPDMVSQVMMAVPLVALYYASIAIAWAIGRQRQRASHDER